MQPPAHSLLYSAPVYHIDFSIARKNAKYLLFCLNLVRLPHFLVMTTRNMAQWAEKRGRRQPADTTVSAEAPTKKHHPMGRCFVIVHRFCCLHSRPPQGRGSVRGEPLTGSPTRVQSPAHRRPLLRSKSAAPKRKHHPDGWCFLFVIVHHFCCQ